jgi:hypothetical protein
MAFKCEILTANDPQWYSNALRFETESEADQYGLDLILRWSGSRDYRVVNSDDAPNYAIIDNKLSALPKAAEA